MFLYRQVRFIIGTLIHFFFRGDKLTIIQFFATHCSAAEQKWLARVILKDLKIGMTEKSILSVWHPQAEDLYNITNSLSRVAEELNDANVSLRTKVMIESSLIFIGTQKSKITKEV